MNAYEAILEALIARGRTGEGADIRVSMFDCHDGVDGGADALHARRHAAQAHRAHATPRSRPTACSRPPTTCRSSSPSRTTANGWCCAPRCSSSPSLRRDPRFATNPARLANRAETDGIVARSLRRAGCRGALAAAGGGRDRICSRQRYRGHPAPPASAAADRGVSRRPDRVAEPSRALDGRAGAELRSAAGLG